MTSIFKKICLLFFIAIFTVVQNPFIGSSVSIFAAEKSVLELFAMDKLKGLTDNTNKLNEELEQMEKQVDDINNRCSSNDLKKNSKLKKEVNALNKEIKALNKSLESISKSITKAYNSLKSLKTRIANILSILPEKEPEVVQPEKPKEEVQEPTQPENPKEEVQEPEQPEKEESVDKPSADIPNDKIYNMALRYDKSKTDKENLQMAIDSGCEYIYLNKDLSLPEGSANSEYIWINRPVYIYGNKENKIDVAIRITADNVTLDNLYITREIRPNRSFNNLTIKNCIVDGSDGMGIHLLNYTDGMVCKNIRIENCILRNNAWHGIAFKGTIPSTNKPANGGNGVGYGEYENVVIKDCVAYNNGYVVQSDGSIKSTHEYSAGINIVDSCYSMKNCVVENCVSYGNYSNGFHMESVPVKENIKIVNCKAYDNGKNANGTHFGCGFSVIDKGVTLQNCVSENNTVANYTVLKNQAHSPFKSFNGEMINCYDDKMLINWNDKIANEVYNGANLIYNGDFKYGSMHYGFYYSSYPAWFYNAPNFLRKNGYKTPYYEAGVHTDKNDNNFIHGKFMTNIFKLDENKKYKLTVKVDNSKNTSKDTLSMGIIKFNYVSDQDTKSNKQDKTVGAIELIKNNDCSEGITTYTAEVDKETFNKLASGYYSLYAKNSAIDKHISLNNINQENLNIKIYDIRLEEVK